MEKFEVKRPIPKLPCLKDKCILLPICKYKEIIKCNILCGFIESLYLMSDDDDIIISQMKNIFPIVKKIKINNKDDKIFITAFTVEYDKD